MNPRPEPNPKRSANIFINYRREDSAGHAGRLFDRLGVRFPGRVFMDVDTIEPGIDFVEVIEQAVGSCEVLIVVIGRDWLAATDAAGMRRLDNPNDFVRLEIAAALARDIRVIPVLVEDAPMPRPEELPADLAKLTRRNAIELSDARFAFDVDRLIQAIEGVLQDKAPSALMPAVSIPDKPALAPKRARRTRLRAQLALAALLLLVLGGGLGWGFGNQSDSRETGEPTSTEEGVEAGRQPPVNGSTNQGHWEVASVPETAGSQAPEVAASAPPPAKKPPVKTLPAWLDSPIKTCKDWMKSRNKK